MKGGDILRWTTYLVAAEGDHGWSYVGVLLVEEKNVENIIVVGMSGTLTLAPTTVFNSYLIVRLIRNVKPLWWEWNCCTKFLHPFYEAPLSDLDSEARNHSVT